MKPFRVILAVAACVATGTAVADQFGCPACRSCGGACVLRVSPVVEEETCYEVECKDVCIPAIRFPWDSCRKPKCGRVRQVAVLKKEGRETKGCQYEWIVVCPRCGDVHDGRGSMPNVPPAPAKPLPSPQMPPSAPPTPPASVGNRDAGFRLRSVTPRRALPGASDQSIRLVGGESDRSITR